MKRIALFFALLLTANFTAQNLYHKISANVNPSTSAIEVIDTVFLPTNSPTNIVFELNSALKIGSVENGEITLIKTERTNENVGMDHDTDTEPLEVSKYLLEIKETSQPVTFSYGGKIDSPIEQSEENYQRGFSQSPGIICEKGVYLAGSTYWIPTFGKRLFGFDLHATLPEGWKTVSQGERLSVNGKYYWHSPEPQEEAFLIAAKFTEYSKDVGAVKAMAFLRTPDDALANKYLETTAQYLEMYRNLIGAYPYKKFALVENFWETGYGMPSFTLLGEKIIRFPFILHSSYPHELLHNWWGNSVYVDFSKGNWCEGITAYMADHLIKEQRGAGADYRRSTLQRFTDYVNPQNDFPPSEFQSRYDGASEAIGYGKTLMTWHMLRKLVGDKNFVKSFRKFYRDFKFKRASFDDIKNSFEEVTGRDLDWFFTQWITRNGAPQLSLSDVTKSKTENGYVVKFVLTQTQKENPFVLDVPIAIFFENDVLKKTVRLDKREQSFAIELKQNPIKIAVDPQFDVMRRLSAEEIPPALTKAFGSKKVICVLPSSSEFNESYKRIAESWIKNKSGEIVYDNELHKPPKDAAVWIFGFENKFVSAINNSLKKYSSAIYSDSVIIDGKKLDTQNKSFVLAIRNPQNENNVAVWLALKNENATAGLIRKLPHYGKYGYLAFEGDEPTNIYKGAWQSVNSPLVYRFEQTETHAKPPKEKALAYLKPVFSAERMFAHIEFLASEKMKGRGLGTPELSEAAKYIAEKFAEYGLQPGGDRETYFQTWQEKIGGKNYEITNVIGFIPGTADSLKDAPLIISAHYDHLGLGWPDVYKGNEGKIHFGADDNASGVAVILELAKILGENYKPLRPVYFIAFSGEEAGLRGSRHFVNNPTAGINVKKIIADLNFDTVGRLNDKKIMILNSNTAREWKFIFMGTDYVTGVPTELIKQQLDASDQTAFIEKGIPAVQFFSGPNKDYHKPTDTIDKIDKAGLVKIATVGKEVLDYLANRPEPLSVRTSKKNQTPKRNGGKTRRVKTGVVPDFTYTGEGVKVADLLDNSPAQKAGLKAGDVIIKVNETEIKNLRDYSNVLKTFAPGDTAKFTVQRNGKETITEIVFEEK